MIEDIVNNNGYDYVDLELPSGTIWATCNVGATKPSEPGLYFQWGDTKGYTEEQVGYDSEHKPFSIDWGDYKFGEPSKLTKYINPDAILELKDDAAHVYMGGDWHMPTDKQIQELIDNTTTNWITSKAGMRFTSKNGKLIFIPAAGGALEGSIIDSGDNGYVWSSTLYAYNIKFSKWLFFNSKEVISSYGSRCDGLPVRGVIG